MTVNKYLRVNSQFPGIAFKISLVIWSYPGDESLGSDLIRSRLVTSSNVIGSQSSFKGIPERVQY